jgi:hypothetical protein
MRVPRSPLKLHLDSRVTEKKTLVTWKLTAKSTTTKVESLVVDRRTRQIFLLGEIGHLRFVFLDVLQTVPKMQLTTLPSLMLIYSDNSKTTMCGSCYGRI